MDSFLGEIRIFPFTFAPRAWAYCNGQTLPISQNTALFSILGVTFGGDGRSSFGLPNLQGRGAIHAGTGIGLSPYTQGQVGGNETVTLNATQAPAHGHTLMGTTAPARGQTPSGESFGLLRSGFYQSSNANLVALNNATLPSVGSGGPHNNLQPYLAMNFCISLAGEYPQRP